MTIDERRHPSRRPLIPHDLRDRAARRSRREQPTRSRAGVLLAYGPDVFRLRFIRPVQPWERLTGN